MTRPARARAPSRYVPIRRRVAWVKAGAEGADGVQAFDYPSIALHAVCTDTSTFPHPCLYCQLDLEGEEAHEPESGIAAWMGGAAPTTQGGGGDDAMGGAADDEAHENGADAADGAVGELRFVPADPSSLDAIFAAMSACAALHPTGDEDEDEDEDEDDEDFDGEHDGVYADGGMISGGLITSEADLTAEQRAMLERFDAILHVPDGAAHEHTDGGATAARVTDATRAVEELARTDPGRFADAGEGHAMEADGDGK